MEEVCAIAVPYPWGARLGSGCETLDTPRCGKFPTSRGRGESHGSSGGQGHALPDPPSGTRRHHARRELSWTVAIAARSRESSRSGRIPELPRVALPRGSAVLAGLRRRAMAVWVSPPRFASSAASPSPRATRRGLGTGDDRSPVPRTVAWSTSRACSACVRAVRRTGHPRRRDPEVGRPVISNPAKFDGIRDGDWSPRHLDLSSNRIAEQGVRRQRDRDLAVAPPSQTLMRP